jgi:hypothetical protein
MIDIVDRLSFDATRCEVSFSRGVASNIECGITEIKRLRLIEAAARRFVKEADESPRYVSVKTWATSEADPYLNLRSALTCQQKENGK